MVSQPLWQEIMKLTVDERWDLIDRLRASIPENSTEPGELDDALKAELMRRLEDMRLHPEDGSDWETTRAMIERSL